MTDKHECGLDRSSRALARGVDMNKLFIVVEGGCVRYVSSDLVSEVEVTVIDLDDLRDDPQPDREAELEAADALPRLW